MVDKKSTKAKSTPKKRTAKKVEVSQPVSEPRQAELVQPQINWDVIGFSSAAVTLLGTAIIFMIGWVYETNWYAYFGIGMEQVSISPQQILVDSLPTLYLVLVSFVMALFIKFTRSKVFSDSQTSQLSKIDFDFIIGIANVFLAFIAITLLLGDLISSKFRIMSNPFQSFAFMIIAFLFLMMVLLPKRVQGTSRDSESKNVNFTFSVTNETSRLLSSFGRWKTLFQCIIIFILSVALSTSIGFGDARNGRKGVGGRLQKVYLVSPKHLMFLQELEQSCDVNNNCIYGPFAFIYENNASFYLTNWKTEKPYGSTTEIFSSAPGFFIIPRSDSNGGYFIIPEPSTDLIPDLKDILPTQVLISTYTAKPESTATNAFTHTPTITMTPTIKPTVIPPLTASP